jgi:ribosomal protein S18 acetylase RimI-like enzyme
MIRKANNLDMNEVATIHKRQFNDHFLGRYSIGLIRKFYETYLDSCIFLVSISDETINGFVMGGRFSDLNQAKQKFIHDNKFHYIIETICRPQIYIQAFNRLRYLKPTHTPDSTSQANSISLLSIAVSESAKGTGIASELINEFEKYVGIDSDAYSLTVKKSNNRAIQFYYRKGFELKVEKEHTIFMTKPLQL